MEMIIWLQSLQESIDLYLIALLTAIIIASIIDFGFGWVNARFNSHVKFESGIALYGIIKKMMYFIVLVFFMGVANLIVPEKVAVPALIVLYVGYLASEINSILSHLELTEDGKTGELFRTFISRLLNGDSNSSDK